MAFPVYFSFDKIAVYYSLDFSYANYEQSRARIRRIGQIKRGVYIHLVCKDTIDEKVMAALKQKADVSKLLVDDYKKSLEDNDMEETRMLELADQLIALREKRDTVQDELKGIKADRNTGFRVAFPKSPHRRCW